MKSTYDAVYARWQDDPQDFWAEAAEAIHWYRKWDRVLDASKNPYYRWFGGRRSTPATTPSIGTSKRVAANQPALIYDSPVTETIKTFTFREFGIKSRGVRALARWAFEGRPGHHLHADDAGSVDSDAGLRADRRDSLGGLRRLCLSRARRRINDAQPKLVVSASCGIELDRIVAYKPLLDAAIEIAAQARAVHRLPASSGRSVHDLQGRDLDWNEAHGGASRMMRAGCCQLIRSTSSTPRARRAQPRDRA